MTKNKFNLLMEPYKNYKFEYRNEKGNNCKFSIETNDYAKAWFLALKTCGWEQRTSLGLIGNDESRQIQNGIIVNWFEIQQDNSDRMKNFHLALSFNLQDRLSSGFYKIESITC